MVAGWSRLTQGHGAVVGGYGSAGKDEHEGENKDEEAEGEPGQLLRHMQMEQELLDSDLPQVEHQQNSGVDPGDARKEHEVGAVKLGGAVQDLAQRHGAKVGLHSRLLLKGLLALGGMLAQRENRLPLELAPSFPIFINK